MQLPCLMQLVQEGLNRGKPEERKEKEIVGETWPVSKKEKRDGWQRDRQRYYRRRKYEYTANKPAWRQ